MKNKKELYHEYIKTYSHQTLYFITDEQSIVLVQSVWLYLIPRVQKHYVILSQIILCELGYLSCNKLARLIGAFKKAWLMI